MFPPIPSNTLFLCKNRVNITGPPTCRPPETHMIGGAAWMRKELCSCRDLPSRAGRPFLWIVCCPLISLHLPDQERCRCYCTDKLKGPADRGLMAQLGVYTFQAEILSIPIKGWDSYLMVTCMISTRYFVISHRLLSQPDHNLGFQLGNPASHTWIQHSNLENWFFSYFPFITVTTKKARFPVPATPAVFLPDTLCRCRPTLCNIWGDAGIVVAIQY